MQNLSRCTLRRKGPEPVGERLPCEYLYSACFRSVSKLVELLDDLRIGFPDLDLAH